jgi:hypothetical protein
VPSNPARSQTDKRLKQNKPPAKSNRDRPTKVTVSINQRYVDFVEGKIKPSDLDDKEIEKGAIRGPNGKFGKTPQYVPAKFHQMMVAELKKRMEAKFAKDVEPMREVLRQIANNPRTSPDARYRSAVYLIDRGIGKVAEKTEATVEVKPWEGMLDELFIEYKPTTSEASTDDDIARPDPPAKPAAKRRPKKDPFSD